MTRELALCLLALAYVAFASAQSGPGSLVLVVTGVTFLVFVTVYRRSQVAAGSDRVSPTARRAAWLTAFGIALYVEARVGGPGRVGLDAAANLGVGIASVSALTALSRVRSLGGMLHWEQPIVRLPNGSKIEATKASEWLDGAAFSGLLWAIATTIPAAFALMPGRFLQDPLLIDYATTSAAAGSLLVHCAATLRLRNLRRVELGVGDRAASAFALSVTALLVAVLGASLSLAPPDRFLPSALCAAAALAAWAATAAEPTSVTRALRGILAVAIAGVPVVVAAGTLAHARPGASGTILIGASVACVFVGLLAQRIAKPLGPEQSRWLSSIEAASRGALSPDPNTALTAALVALQSTASSGNARAEIWRQSPSEVLTVDVAGYLHVERAEAPERLYELALGEPERTLRIDALAAVEVRRPEVRGLLAWFRARGAYSVTVVCDEDGPLGFVLLPGDSRGSPLTLEEARALRGLSDRISSLISVSAALSRARERELFAQARADELQAECERLSHAIGAQTARHRWPAERLARGVRTTAFSPAARLALEGLERLSRLDAPLALLTPPGVDAEGFAAHSHLCSPRADGPLVTVDATEREARSLEVWRDKARSPLVAADGGTLLILGASALPLEIQEHLALYLTTRALAESASQVLPAGLVFGLPSPAQSLLEAGRLHEGLARSLGDRQLQLPRLADRAEDLRALVLEGLSRFGVGTSGEPLGIEPAALAALTEHEFPGNELELFGLIARTAATARGTRLTLPDLLGSGLSSASHNHDVHSELGEDPSVNPPPSLAVRRRSLRRAPGR
jgi:transcriptional regulator with AAA-type ATPase domain